MQSAPSSPGPHRDEPVGADAPVAVAERARSTAAPIPARAVVVSRRRHEEVVAGGVELGEHGVVIGHQRCQEGGQETGADSPAVRTR